MTRQRMRPSLQSSTSLTCPHCNGTGFVKSHESLAIELIRLLNFHAAKNNIKQIELSVSIEVADYLQNEKRVTIMQIEQQSDKRIVIHGSRTIQEKNTASSVTTSEVPPNNKVVLKRQGLFELDAVRRFYDTIVFR